jgi:hypothetical protein
MTCVQSACQAKATIGQPLNLQTLPFCLLLLLLAILISRAEARLRREKKTTLEYMIPARDPKQVVFFGSTVDINNSQRQPGAARGSQEQP